MIIKSVDLNNYRNYSLLHCEFCEGINILYGDNAQGKTNLLEAAFISGTSKSHRCSKDRELISFGNDEAHICTVIEKSGISHTIDIHLRKNKSKGIAIDKIPIKKASELFGLLNIVFFSPEDLNIIKDGPSERRRFIDQELCQIDKVYLSNLTNYNKVLNNRNRLLKDIHIHPELKDTLQVWDNQLITYGSRVIEGRKEFISSLDEIVCGMHKKIAGDDKNLQMGYECDTSAESFEENLLLNYERDLRFEMTSVGPHRDDIFFRLEHTDIRKYGSQGQQRTVALALKLAEIELVKKQIGESPVLLLDDVLSELDSNRRSFLLSNLNSTQTIITCTGLDEFIKNNCRANKIIKITNGTISEESMISSQEEV